MRSNSLETAIDDSIHALAGFDAGEREWIRENALKFLREEVRYASRKEVWQVVQEWAAVLTAREAPFADDMLEPAIDAALRLHPGVSRELEVFCRHLIRRWASDGNLEFHTVGEIFDIILITELVVGPAELASLQGLADTAAEHVQAAFNFSGLPDLSAEEKVWLHGEILADFATCEFSPFFRGKDRVEARHVKLLVKRLWLRRNGLTAAHCVDERCS
jgi:hypothetical protein